MQLSMSNGYVIYQRGIEARRGYWQRLYEAGVAEANSLPSLYKDSTTSKYEVAGSRLFNLGKKEQQKEILLIKKVLGDDTVSNSTDIKEFIKLFNHVMIGKVQFENALFRLDVALSKESQGKEFRAPTIASYFTSYLATALTANINDWLKGRGKELATKDFLEWDMNLNQLVDQSIKDAFEDMLTIDKEKAKEIYGSSESWEEVLSAVKEIEGFDSDFKKMVKSKIDFNRLSGLLKDEKVNLKNKKNNNISTLIKTKDYLNLGSDKKSRGIGGSVQETLMQIMEQMGLVAQSAVSKSGKTMSSEIMKTDTIALYSFDKTINTEEIVKGVVDGLDKAMEPSKNLAESVEIMKKYNEQHLSKLNESFIVYGSTKSYSMSDSFREFGGGGERKLEAAAGVINQAGVASPDVVSRYINAAYSTIPDAILEGRTEIKEELKVALMSSMAELLFDDWTTIGEQKVGAQAIHVLQLEGVEIPLSVFLMATGAAMRETASNMESLAKIIISVPKEILYKDTINVKGDQLSIVTEKWNEQLKAAKSQSTFEVKFLSNFKTMIKKWIDIS